MDSLCHVVEDSRGELIGHIETMPPRRVGVPEKLPKQLPDSWATTVDGNGATDRTGDDKVNDGRLRSSREGRPWESWGEAKTGYTKPYGLHLASLGERAKHPWDVEELTDKLGQGIPIGQSFSVPMLERGENKLAGPGAEFLRVELDAASIPPRPGSLDLLHRAQWRTHHQHTQGALHWAECSKGGRLTWTYFWAGTTSNQPRYNQCPYDGCAVGCAPVVGLGGDCHGHGVLGGLWLGRRRLRRLG